MSTVSGLGSGYCASHNAVGVEGHVTVFGDLHGQYYDMMHALEMCGLPSDTHTIIFNGDLVDRGSWSVEVIFLAMCLKIWRPDRVHIARGNHEAESMTKVYGFQVHINSLHLFTIMYPDSSLLSLLL